jgi:hypothetical protein
MLSLAVVDVLLVVPKADIDVQVDPVKCEEVNNEHEIQQMVVYRLGEEVKC